MERINKEISFWEPVTRDWGTGQFKLPRQLYDLVIDPFYTNPLKGSAHHVVQEYTSTTFIVQDEKKGVNRFSQCVRMIVVIAGLIFCTRTTLLLLAAGLTIKYLARSQEIYQTRVLSPSRTPTPQEIYRAWAIQNLLGALFPLYARGYDEKIALPEDHNDSTTITIQVYIGDEVAKYPLSFLNSTLYFRGLLLSGMKEVQKDGIHLSEDCEFTHKGLQALRTNLNTSSGAYWGNNSEEFANLCDFLGLKTDEGGKAPLIKKFVEEQCILQNKNYTNLPHCDPAKPPSVKICSYTFNIDSTILTLDFGRKSDDEAIQYATEQLNTAMGLESAPDRHYYVNGVISEFVAHLFRTHSPRDSKVDVITPLLNLKETLSEIADYVTVLSLPRITLKGQENNSLLAPLLGAFPNLKWLTVELCSDETFCIENVVKHKELRVLKIEGKKIMEEQESQLRALFPNLDVLEGD